MNKEDKKMKEGEKKKIQARKPSTRTAFPKRREKITAISRQSVYPHCHNSAVHALVATENDQYRKVRSLNNINM